MAETSWDFNSITDYQISQELIRGLFHSISRNDQLYIWVRSSDVETLSKGINTWLSIKESVYRNYRSVKVDINIKKNFPMSVILRTGNSSSDEIVLRDYGNLALLEKSRILELNKDLPEVDRYIVKFGTSTSKTLLDALRAGMKFRKYCTDLTKLGYTMISTKESGLITESLDI